MYFFVYFYCINFHIFFVYDYHSRNIRWKFQMTIWANCVMWVLYSACIRNIYFCKCTCDSESIRHHLWVHMYLRFFRFHMTYSYCYRVYNSGFWMCFDVTSFTKELFFIVYEMSTASMLIRMRDIVVDRQNSRDLKHPLSFTKLHKLSSGGESKSGRSN